MKTISIVVFCMLTISLYAKPNVTFYQEYADRGFALYADNHEVSPVYVQFDFVLRNLQVEDKYKRYYVIPPKSVKHKITSLVVINALDDYSFTYTAETNFGDPNHTNYDAVFQYYLPFKKGASSKIIEGYNGSSSHHNTYAIDFEMPVGTEIHAARSGIVVSVEQSNSKSCETKTCEKNKNYILVYHSDGTFAEYSHIKQNGSLVKRGDIVEKGKPIGYSGNVGWSSSPHLHFEVYLPQQYSKRTLKTNFLTGDGSDYSLLAENVRYTRNY